MRRILLLLEEYNELVFIETFLRKIGFDVLGIQKPGKLDSSILSFNPSMIFISGKSKQIPALQIAKGLKEKFKEKSPQIIFLYSGKPPEWSESENLPVDGFLNSPIDPVKVIQLLSEKVGLDQEKLIEKYDKMVVARENQIAREQSDKDVSIISYKDDQSDRIDVKGSVETENQSTMLKDVKPRGDHYKKFLDQQPKVDTKKTLPAAAMRKAAKELSASNKDGDPSEEDRRQATEEFLKALFKKN